jgi:hypothetical protein
VGIEIARGLAACLGIEPVPVEYAAPPKVMEALNIGACDVGLLGIDPSRVAEVDFSPPPVNSFKNVTQEKVVASLGM